MLKEVSSFFNELHGCDISQFAIIKARQKIPNADLRVVNIEALSYPDDMFDCITALDVLEHTCSFEKSFANLVKKLKSGGYLILSAPINNCLRKMFGFLDKDKTHISVLSESEIIQIINKHKLKIIRIRRFCPFPIFYRIPYIPAAVELILKKG
ncbi:methyltransferase domain-containing protein [Candidatus Bathyarchaeota archaeon]|nr:methyltransferase domain-containing protein [Candidatus Bathyarchaeota archaeon]